MRISKSHRYQRSARGGLSVATGRASIAAIIIGWAMLAPGASRADLVPSPGFPDLNPLTGQYGVSYQYQTAVSAFGFTSGTNSGQSDSKTAYPTSPDGQLVVPSVTDLAISPLNPVFAPLVSRAADQIGGLVGGGGVMHAYAEADVHAGLANSLADVTVIFIDKMHVTQTGIPDFHLALEGAVSGVNFNPAENSSGIATAQMFVFPVSTGIPAAGQYFDAAYYERHVVTAGGDSVIGTPAVNTVFAAGTDWYVAGTLEVRAMANLSIQTVNTFGDAGLDLTGIADYSHTAIAHIDPSAATPDFGYTMASGASYSSTPEPASMFGIFGAMLMLIAPRRRR